MGDLASAHCVGICPQNRKTVFFFTLFIQANLKLLKTY